MEPIHNLKYIRLLNASQVSIDELNDAFEDFAHAILCHCMDDNPLGKVYFWLNHIKTHLLVNKYRHDLPGTYPCGHPIHEFRH